MTTNPECAWTATSLASWISLSQSSGQGTASVELRVTPNDGSVQRDGNVIVNSEQVRVSQRAPCRFEIAPAAHTMAEAGGSGRVTVSAPGDCAWTATIEVSWISLSAPVSGSGNGSVAFVVEANNAHERTGHIVIAGQRSTVSQLAVVVPTPRPPPTPTPPSTPTPPPPPPCTFTISPTSQSVAAGGGAGSADVVTQDGCRWTAASSTSWITVTLGSSGTGKGLTAFTVGANTGPARTGSLTIAGSVFTVTQAPCTFTISPTSQSVAAVGGAGSADVVTQDGCRWTAASSTSWITVTSGSSGTGNGSMAFTVGANTGPARTGSLTIAGTRVHRHAGVGLHLRAVEEGGAIARERGRCVRGRLDDERLPVDGDEQHLVADHSVGIQRYRQWPGDVLHWREHRRDADRLPHGGRTSFRRAAGRTIRSSIVRRSATIASGIF